MENIPPKEPENSEDILLYVTPFIFQKVRLYLLKECLQLLLRQIIELLAPFPFLILLPKDISMANVQLAPMCVAFQPALFSAELGGPRYGFSFLPPTALLRQFPEAENPAKTH